jgi:hypothetical protein
MNLFDLKQQLQGAGILMCFTGSFGRGIVEELGTAVKKYLESSDESRKSAMTDVFSVYIEAAQNVRNYSERNGASNPAVIEANIVVIARSDEHYLVYAGNLVDAGDVPGLTVALDRLAALDKPGLKAAYKEQMRKERNPDGGAGLGLIEMARRATGPLSYTFTPTANGQSYFSLCVTI